MPLDTPLYCSQYQPIELMWAKSKGEVANDWYPHRGIRGTYEALMNFSTSVLRWTLKTDTSQGEERNPN